MEQRVKVAVAMNGGVSLAVWIGGVVAELYRCQRQLGTYGQLQRLLDCKVEVDVITGSSAGGLNGALLGTAIAQDLPVDSFDGLKQVWLQVGDFAALLRDPLDRNPPSLMKGNEVFLPEVERLLRSWLSAGKTTATPDVELYLTTTPLEPSVRTYSDRLGTVLREPVTRAHFSFGSSDFSTAVTATDRELLARRLAIAARASASFPGAFEPVFVRINGTPPPNTKKAPTAAVDMQGCASLTASRWVMDGGVLVNKPVGPAIDIIQHKPIGRNQRRVLLYVVPDPGTGPSDAPAELGSPPTLATVVSKALLTLPRAESISGDLQSMRAHNRQVHRQHKVRTDLLLDDQLRGALGATASSGLWDLAGTLYPLWKLWRDRRAADERIDDFLARADGDRNLTVKDKLYTWQEVIEALAQIRRSSGFLPGSISAAVGPSGGEWPFGHQTLISACELLQDVAHDALGANSDPIAGIGARLAEFRTVLQCIETVNTSYWDAALLAGPAPEDNEPIQFAQRLFTEWPIAAGNPQALNDFITAFDEFSESPETSGIWHAPVLSAFQPLEWQTTLRQVEWSIALELDAAQTELLKHLDPDSDRKWIRQLWKLSARHDDLPVAEHLALHIVASMMGGTEETKVDIDFIQISSDIDCPADPSRFEPADKVTGIQLGHFGGFYKESWRANDWMWGRIDGSLQLLGMLLEPARVRHSFYGVRAVGAEEKACVAGQKFAEAAGVVGWDPQPGAAVMVSAPGDDPDIRARHELWGRQWNEGVKAELVELFSTTRLPTSLPLTTRALARIVQLEIARDELPDVAAAIERSSQAGGATSPRTRNFENQTSTLIKKAGRLTLDETKKLLPVCNVGRERIKDEIGSDLLTSTASTTAAVAITALSGEHSGTGVLRPLVKSVRTAVLTAYLVMQNAVRRTRTAFALTQLLLAFGGAALAVHWLGGDVSSPILVLAYVALGAWLAVTALTIGAYAALLPLAAAGLVVGAALLGKDKASEFFGALSEPSWKRSQLRWAWTAPALIGGIAALFYKVRTRSLLRRMTLPETRKRIERIWGQRSSVPDNEVGPFDDLLTTEVGAMRTKVNRSRRGMWVSLALGAIFTVLARPTYRYVFLHRGGHPKWITAADWFENRRPAIVLLAIPCTAIALSLLRLGKLAAGHKLAGEVPRWPWTRWIIRSYQSMTATTSNIDEPPEPTVLQRGYRWSARWLGFGQLSGVGAFRWFSRRIARALPVEDDREMIMASKQDYVVTLQGTEGERTMGLDSWLLQANPAKERVVTILRQDTGALVPRRRLPMSAKNGPVMRTLRHIPLVKNLKFVRWSQST